MFFRKEASWVNNSVELMCLSSQGVWAQRTHLGEVEKGQHVSASHHPGAVDYATMLWLAPYQMTTNSHLLEVRAMPTEFHINWTLNPSWFQFYCKTTSLWVTTAHLPDKRKYFKKQSTDNVFKFQKHTQTNLYPKISALNILFFLKNNVEETIPSRSFWFHLQPGRYKLCTHKMDLNSAGFLFTHSWKYLFHTKNTRE